MENNNGEETQTTGLQTMHCNLCGKKGQFLCGKCLDVAYCKLQHQKIDWASHKSKCISLEDKIKLHNKEKYGVRAQIFELLSEGRFYEAAQQASQLMEKQKRFCETSSNIYNQLEYGASAVMLTRIWIYYKDFNKALDILNAYLQVKMSFLRSVENLPLPEKGFPSEPQAKDIIQKKLNLISAVASVSHQLVRNSMDIIEILINHIEVVYGPQSLETSNVYFYAANYLHFLNQPQKALACFLKAAKLRGSKCSVPYYNAGVICMELKNYSTALDLLLLSVNNLTENQRAKHPQLQAQLYEALAMAYKNLNIFNKTVMSLERALCLREKYRHLSPQNETKYQKVLRLLSTIKSQADKLDSQIKIYVLPKQKSAPPKNIDINMQNFKHVNVADKEPHELGENEDWVESFNEFKKRLNVISGVPQIPYVAKSKLFGKEMQVVRQEEQPSEIKSKDKSAEQKIHVNLQLIERLSSSQVDFLNEVNRLIIECKDKSAIIDIFENSNLYQTLSKQKLDLIYRLNPKLHRRDSVSRKINIREPLQDANQNIGGQFEFEATTPQKKSKIVTPKLNLENIKRNV